MYKRNWFEDEGSKRNPSGNFEHSVLWLPPKCLSFPFFPHFQTLFQFSKKKNRMIRDTWDYIPKSRLQLLLDPIPHKGVKKTTRRNLSLNEDHSQAFNFLLMFSFSLFYTQLRIITVLLLCLGDPFTLWESHTVYSDHIHTLLLPVAPLRYVPLPLLSISCPLFTLFKKIPHKVQVVLTIYSWWENHPPEHGCSTKGSALKMSLSLPEAINYH